MRQFLFDEISPADIKKIKRHLTTHAEAAPVGDIYWVSLPEKLWDETQTAHKGCQPFYFAIEVGRNYLRVEWLIRSRQKLRCECVKYASPAQLNFILDYSERLLKDLNIRT